MRVIFLMSLSVFVMALVCVQLMGDWRAAWYQRVTAIVAIFGAIGLVVSLLGLLLGAF